MAGLKRDGLSNQGFEESNIPTVCATVSMETTSAGIYVDHEQGKNNSLSPSGLSNEEIDLREMEYRHLCSCEENGRTCQCAEKSKALRRITLESWNRCKTIAICLIVGLVGVWVIVYVTLSQMQKL